MTNVADHYDKLIDEGNDPFRDPAPLKEYMDKWDGNQFIDLLKLSPDKNVLEIGIGTGRLACRVAVHCKSLRELTFLQRQLHVQKKICRPLITYPTYAPIFLPTVLPRNTTLYIRL